MGPKSLGFENDSEDYNFPVTNDANVITAEYENPSFSTFTDRAMWCEDVLLFDDLDGDDVVDVTRENVGESVFVDSYDTIQAANNNANDGDVVLVRKSYGSDTFPIVLNVDNLLVAGFDPSDRPTIDGGSAVTVFELGDGTSGLGSPSKT